MLTVLQNTPKGSSISFQPTDSPNKVITALQNTPHPEIASGTEVSPESIAMGIQHEVVIGKKSSDKIQHVATKDLAQCIFLYIHNDDNYLAIHIDNPETPLELHKHIQKFTSHKNMKVTLIGGSPDVGHLSLDNLFHVIRSLLFLSKSMPIEINSQYLIKDNAFKASGKPAFIRDKMLLKASALYQKRYQERLDIEEFKDFKASHLSETHTPADHKLQIMAVCLNNANEVTSKTGEKALQMVEPIFASYFPDKETFKSAL
ncbi:MAG: hypothetical protein ACHQAX_09970, partial [Gammaproteobacteria bacterium]